MIDLHRLRVLVTFAETGTLTATAERLNFTQPTVSHHLQRLQAETGAVLLTQVGRRLHLTTEGRMLAQRGLRLLATLDQTERDLRAMAAMETGVVRLAAFPSAVPTLVPALLSELATKAPGLAVELTDAEPPDSARLLQESAVDVALTFSYPGDPASGADAVLHSVSLGHDPLYLVTRGPEGPKLDDHVDSRWIAGCERCRGHLLAACAEFGFAPRIGYTSDDYVAAQALVATGFGVTLLPGLAIRAHAHPGVHLSPLEAQTRTITAVTLGRPPHTPAVTLVLATAAHVGARLLAQL